MRRQVMETVINSSRSWSITLLNTITIGKELLYSTELAYSMLLMNVVGELHLGVSTMYITTVGKAVLNSSMMICPPALHVNDSICPGVSMKM